MNDSNLPAYSLSRLGRAVLDSVSEAIIYADRDGAICFWNPGAERLFGFTAAEALGRSLDIITPEPQRARHWAGFDRVMQTGESRYGHGDVLAVPAHRKDGTRISIEFTIIPIRAEDGRIEGMMAILRDVTQRYEETRALKRELAALKASMDTSRASPGAG
ncbi:PAS domain-containing protein [Falsiroseomonas sp. HW251]|uniref:PAS domain-containing protein n=1 Tax=Falsiroseomonas sp. HW251 TaxID=3390998 RepID=UPI003D3184A2